MARRRILQAMSDEREEELSLALGASGLAVARFGKRADAVEHMLHAVLPKELPAEPSILGTGLSQRCVKAVEVAERLPIWCHPLAVVSCRPIGFALPSPEDLESLGQDHPSARIVVSDGTWSIIGNRGADLEEPTEQSIDCHLAVVCELAQRVCDLSGDYDRLLSDGSLRFGRIGNWRNGIAESTL